MSTAVFLVLLAIAGACSGRTSNTVSSLVDGEWTADMKAAEVPAALGFIANVSNGGQSLAFNVPEFVGFKGGAVSNLRVHSDTLSFSWKSEDRTCVLTRQNTGEFVGPCAGNSSSPWDLRLYPPSMRRMRVGHARTISQRADYAWKESVYRWGRLYVSGRTGNKDVDTARVAAGIGQALADGLLILGAHTYSRPVDAFIVDGREDLRALTGRPTGSTSDPLGSTVILAGHGSFETVNRHEIMHVLSLNLWGTPPEPAAWLREGIATYAGGRCGRYKLHQISADMQKSGDLIPLDTLIHAFYEHNDLVTYLQSGSIIQFLFETRGREFVRKVWSTGLEQTLRESGSSVPALENEWRERLRVSLPPEPVDWSTIKGIGCG